MYYLIVLHYSLIKGLYRVRHKNLNEMYQGAGFLCFFILIFSLVFVSIDKDWIWEPNRKLKLRALGLGIIILITMFFYILSSKIPKKNKIKAIRKVLRLKSKLSIVYSVTYVIIFVLILFGGIIFVASSK
jgi:uncharacterized membrane protein